MFTLDEAKPSCLNEKGSNDRPFRIDVFTIATKPLNITHQMRQMLLSISPEIVPNVLTTDSLRRGTTGGDQRRVGPTQGVAVTRRADLGVPVRAAAGRRSDDNLF